jgi:hypothetical protein
VRSDTGYPAGFSAQIYSKMSKTYVIIVSIFKL